MGETTDLLRGANYEVAEAIAPTWERRREDIEKVSAPVRGWLLKALDPRPGDTVLELAAGVGDTGFEAARLVGPEGRLVTSDFAPSMLAAARRRGEELGITNVEYREIDAHRIDLETDSVDGVLCRFGYMLMDDPAAALRETRRVLKPGGRVALAVWGPLERNPFFATIAGVLIKGGHVPPPDPSAPGIFSLADASRTETLVRGAGFSDVRAEYVPVTFEIPTITEYINVIADTAGPLGVAVRTFDPATRRSIEAEVEEAFRGFSSNGGYEIPGVALCAVAT